MAFGGAKFFQSTVCFFALEGARNKMMFASPGAGLLLKHELRRMPYVISNEKWS